MRAEWDTSPEPFAQKRICAKCGKEFMPAVFHQYVDYGRNNRKLYYCSYSCHKHRDVVRDLDAYGKPCKGKAVQIYDLDGDFIAEFQNATQAAIWLAEMGVETNIRKIQRCCRGETKSYHKFKFKYKEVSRN